MKLNEIFIRKKLEWNEIKIFYLDIIYKNEKNKLKVQ